MPTFKELIVNTDFIKVWEKFIIHYPNLNDSMENFSKLYKNLKLTSPLSNKTNLYIYINVFQENADEKSLNTMTNENFVAHCLWEMTFHYGYDDTSLDNPWICSKALLK